MMRKKLNEISSYEALLCVLVVLIHVLSEAVGGYEKGSALSAAAFFISRASTFVVPAFIISSGIKLTNKFKDTKMNYAAFIFSRLKKIYLPYAAAAAAYYLYFAFRLHYFEYSTTDLLYQILTGTAASPFYFIVIIMQFYLTAPLWLAICRSTHSGIGITVFAVLTAAAQLLSRSYIFGDRILPCYMVYWALGCYIGMDFEGFISKIHSRKHLTVALGTLFTVLYSAMAYAEFLGMFHSFLTELVKLMFSLSASVMYLALMPKNCPALTKKLASVTYQVYLIHCLVLTEVNFLLDRAGIVSLSLRLVIRFFAVYAISFSAALLYVHTKSSLKSALRRPK